MTTKLNLAQAIQAARAVTEARLDLEGQIGQHKLHGPFDADFTKRWYGNIANAAALGMTACHVPLHFPRALFPALYRASKKTRRNTIKRIVGDFLEGSGLRVSYADWHVGAPISVIVLLSWRSTGRV